jgi:hypothetical protein
MYGQVCMYPMRHGHVAAAVWLGALTRGRSVSPPVPSSRYSTHARSANGSAVPKNSCRPAQAEGVPDSTRPSPL